MAQPAFTGSISDALDEAVRRQSAGRLDDAARFCDAILAARPEHAEALHLRGILAFQSDQAGQAAELIRRAAAAAPGDASCHNSLGGVLIHLGAYEEAVEWLRRSVALAPDEPLAQVNLGIALYGIGDRGAAADCLRRGVGMAPGHAQARAALGLMAFDDGRFTDAAAELSQAAGADARFAYGASCFLGEDFADRTAPAGLSDLLAGVPPLEGELPDSGRRGMVVTTACDHGYFRNFGRALALSVARNAPGTDFHFHVFNPKRSFDAEMAKLGKRLGETTVTVSRETAPGADPLYFSNMRFARFHQIQAACGRDLLCLDTDSLVRAPLDGIADIAGDVAIQTRPDKAELGQQVLATTTLFRDTPAGREFLARLAAYILTCARDGGLAWYLDQSAIYIVWRMMRRAGLAVSLASLPAAFADSEFGPASPVWAAKGNRKLDLVFTAEAARLTG